MNRRWLEPWIQVLPSQKLALHAQLQRVLTRRHSLFGLKLELMGRRFDCPLVVVKVDNKRWLVIDLTQLETIEPEKAILNGYESWGAFAAERMAVDAGLVQH